MKISFFLFAIVVILSTQSHSQQRFYSVWHSTPWDSGGISPNSSVWSMYPHELDLDNDGKKEFLCASAWSDTFYNLVYLYENNGNNNYQLVWWYSFYGYSGDYSNVAVSDLDNDGNALVGGSLYFNTVSNIMKVYTGSAWVAAYVSGSGYLSSANNLSDLASASTARTNLGLGSAATLTAGTSANNVVQLTAAAKLPAVDGSLLTSLAATQINANVSNTEFGYLDGVTSAIQTQIDNKAGAGFAIAMAIAL